MFNEGFVFGKFYPLHKGHLALIEFALSQCHQLNIIVCCSNKELISSSVRASWINASIPDKQRIRIIEYDYEEENLPNTSITSRDVSAAWSDVFKVLLPDAELVVTSEPYGDLVAEFMQIQHKMFDQGRNHYSISASDIRKDILSCWDYLPKPVQHYFQRIVSICGAESTGKTCLAMHLQTSLPAIMVAEVARELIPHSNHFSLDDLQRIAIEHAKIIEDARKALSPLVILDTDVYITQSYASYKFKQTLELPDSIYRINAPDLRLYLDTSAPFIQDGTRLTEIERNQLDHCHRQTLKSFQQDFVEITGSDWSMRTQMARHQVTELFRFLW